jgi:effector-binding domain-containing protein
MIAIVLLFVGCGDSYEATLQKEAKKISTKLNLNDKEEFENCFVSYIKSNYKEAEYSANSLVYIGKATLKCQVK